jgi:uncharacterized repeat protein (TIGR03803 family)
MKTAALHQEYKDVSPCCLRARGLCWQRLVERRMPRILSVTLAVLLLGAAASGQVYTESILYTFSGASFGNHPSSGLIQASDGNFYGTLYDYYGFNGSVYRLTPSGEFTTIYAFGGGLDGALPETSLIEGPDGALYGTTSAGGGPGVGNVFRLTLDGQLTPLFMFTGYRDGYGPATQLTLGSDGWIYGAMPSGGITSEGSIFKVSTDGEYERLQVFSSTGLYHGENNFADGDAPVSPLLEYVPGEFLGATALGGAEGYPGYGTLYSINSQGGFRVVTSLSPKSGVADPGDPYLASFLQASDGNMYSFDQNGVDSQGDDDGIIFRVNSSGVPSVLHALQTTEGSSPTGLILGSNGLMYGSAFAGGANGSGSIFSVTTSGDLNVLYSFAAGTSTGDPEADGRYPFAPIQGADGNFYGPTSGGGTTEWGILYRLSADPPLPAPV